MLPWRELKTARVREGWRWSERTRQGRAGPKLFERYQKWLNKGRYGWRLKMVGRWLKIVERGEEDGQKELKLFEQV